jgi:hypothetical protein
MTENKCFPAIIKNVQLGDPYEKQDIYEIVLFGNDGKVHEMLIKNDRALPI